EEAIPGGERAHADPALEAALERGGPATGRAHVPDHQPIAQEVEGAPGDPEVPRGEPAEVVVPRVRVEGRAQRECLGAAAQADTGRSEERRRGKERRAP